MSSKHLRRLVLAFLDPAEVTSLLASANPQSRSARYHHWLYRHAREQPKRAGKESPSLYAHSQSFRIVLHQPPLGAAESVACLPARFG